MKRKISIIIISIIYLSIFTYADFHELFEEQFPLTNFSEIYQNPNNQDQFLFTSMPNGVGIMTIDGAANITFTQNGTVGRNASPQILNNYAYFVENAEPGNYSQIFKYDLINNNVVGIYGGNGILGQITIDSVGVTRTYYIKDNYLYALNSNFIYQGSASGTTMSDINESPVKIVVSPQNDQMIYILRSGSNKIYVADARASCGREFQPYIYTFKENTTENYIDFAFTTDYSTGDWILGAVTDQQNFELYNITSGETFPNFIESENFSSLSNSEICSSITGDPNNHSLYLAIPDAGKILLYQSTIAGNDFSPSNLENVDRPEKIYAYNNKLYVLVPNIGIELYPAGAQFLQPRINTYTENKYIKFLPFDNTYIGISEYGTCAIYAPLFPCPNLISTFVAPSEINFNSTFSDRITYAKRPGTSEFSIKNSKVITKYHLEGNAPIMDFQIPVNSPGKDEIAYIGDNIFYPVPLGIEVYDCTSSNTSFISLSGTPERLLKDNTPGHEILIGAYTGGSDTLFIIEPYGKNVTYEGQAPDYINFRPETMCLDIINNRLLFLPNIPSNEIVVIDYVDPSNPAHKNTIFNERDVLQLGASQDNVVYTDYDGADYYIHFLWLDQNGNVLNDDTYSYYGNYDGFNAFFFTFKDKLAITTGNMFYKTAEYIGGPSPDNYDYYPYPNPTDGIVHIANLKGGTKIRVLSSDGWEINNYEMDSDGIFTVDLKNINDTYLSSGRYMIILDMPDENKPIVKAVYFNRDRR